jgi:molybdopterin adenylyltransferase
MSTPKIGILTISDRASRGEYEDRSGPAIRDYLNKILSVEWDEDYEIVEDERETIEAAFERMAHKDGCSLILATGGTGPAPRDVTPEALLAVADKEMVGFGELMRKVSLEEVPTAILSRQTAAIVGQALVILLPGKPAAIETCLNAVFPAVPYCVDLIEGDWLDTDPEHIETFRPKKKKK